MIRKTKLKEKRFIVGRDYRWGDYQGDDFVKYECIFSDEKTVLLREEGGNTQVLSPDDDSYIEVVLEFKVGKYYDLHDELYEGDSYKCIFVSKHHAFLVGREYDLDSDEQIVVRTTGQYSEIEDWEEVQLSKKDQF